MPQDDFRPIDVRNQAGRRLPFDKAVLLTWLSIPALLVVVLVLLFSGGLFIWYGCRIDVESGHFSPLMKKTGNNLSNEMVLAPSADFKGPQSEILQEGRHFRNPYVWRWPSEPLRATMIDKGRVGIIIRQYGKALPPGEVIARNIDEKGIVLEPLRPGRHYLNTWAYEVEIVDMVKIEPGYMGVVSLLVGKEPKKSFEFTVNRGERGIQPFLLPPGTHPEYSNKYICRVTPIDVRSHKLEMVGEKSISFPSKYGFDIRVEGIIEWAPDLKKLPELFVKFVDEEDLEKSGGINNIEQKVIFPFVRSFFRTVGGSYRAVDYITGSTRIVVQNEVEKRLREACAAEGILIKSVVIKATKPPQQLRQQYERREIAKRLKDRYEKEIEMEIGNAVMVGQNPKLDPDGNPVLDETGKVIMTGGKAKLDPEGKPVREGGRLKQKIFQRKKDREQQFGLVRKEIAKKVREAEQYQAVQVTQAQKELAVAKIKLEAAKDMAAAVLAQGKAEAAVTVMQYEAEAEGVKAKVKAFGVGDKYAEYTLITKLAPGISEILSNTEGLFAQLFARFISLTESDRKKSGKHRK